MIALLVPPFPDVESALDWLEERGTIIRACLVRAEDGSVRGVATLRPRS